MASRVSVTVDVRDHSRAGIQQVRNAIRRMNDDIRRSGGTADFRVNVVGSDLRRARLAVQRLQQQLSGQTVRINTRVEPPDRNRFRRSVLNTLTSPARTTGSVLGGILSDGIGQGIVQGFKTAGPAGMVVFAGILTTMVSILGASLSGLIVTALGAAFVGVGVVSAAQSEKVKAKWKDVLASLKEDFRSVGEPMIPVLERALDKLEEMSAKAAPKLKQALEDTVPATNAFFDGIAKGFESFGKAAFDRIMEAWNVFAPVFGEQWDEFMRELGDAFGDMADLVKEHPTEIALALEVVFEILELLVRTVTFFGDVWVAQMQFAFKSAGLLGQAIEFVGNAFLDMTGTIIDGLAGAFGWIPGLGPKLEDAAAAFGTFKENAKNRLGEIGNAGRSMGDALDRANKVRKLQADISSYQHKLSIARADLKKTSDQKARAKLQADITDLNNKIASARSKLNALNGKTATTYVRTVQYGIGAEAANAARRATGGVVGPRRPVGQAATGGIRGNLTMVGESGPELVQLPTGSHVRSNSDSRRMLAKDRVASHSRLLIDAAGDDVSQFLLRLLRHAIRNEGGDVEVVLGRG